jgi:hypothetical protein
MRTLARWSLACFARGPEKVLLNPKFAAYGLIATSACGGSTLTAVAAGSVDDASECSATNVTEPTTLATGQGLPGGIAVTATQVFWINYGEVSAGPVVGPILDGQVVTCAKSGCGGQPTVLASGLAHPTTMAVDTANVYWTDDNGAVMRLSADGGTPITLATGQSASAIAIEGSNLYLANDDGTINQVPVSGGPVLTLASGQNNPAGIAVDSAAIYWSSYGDGTIAKVAIDGGSPVLLASAQSRPLAIAVDSTNVYFTNDHGGSVVSVPVAGGVPVTLASVDIAQPNDQPTGIAIDGTNVYWTDGRGNEVLKVGVTGGSPVVVGQGQSFLNGNGVAVDCSNVYWTDLNGTVMAAPKD